MQFSFNCTLGYWILQMLIEMWNHFGIRDFLLGVSFNTWRSLLLSLGFRPFLFFFLHRSYILVFRSSPIIHSCSSSFADRLFLFSILHCQCFISSFYSICCHDFGDWETTNTLAVALCNVPSSQQFGSVENLTSCTVHKTFKLALWG